MAPQDRPERDVGVGAVADRDTHGVALLLENFPGLEEVVPGLRRLEPGPLEVRFVVAPGERDPEPRHRPPPRARLTRLTGERVPAAVPVAEVGDEIAHVDQLLLVEEWIGGAGDDQVVAGLRGRLGGALGEQLRAGDRVDAHGDPGLFGEDVRLTPELVVGGRDEVIEGEERQLALLGERRRALEEGRRRAGERPRRGFEESPTADHAPASLSLPCTASLTCSWPQSIARLVGMPFTALATMSGST